MFIRCDVLSNVSMIANRRPDPRLLFAPEARRLVEPGRAFFRRETVRVARDLVGAWIARRWRGRWYGARIVETEAYLGPKDRAAHSWNGRRTPRVEPMYADGGHLYVFLVYGMHHCANVVTRREGVAEAVLLRAGEGPEGAPARLLSGPGKLCAALGITTVDSGRDLLDEGPLRLLVPRRRPRRKLRVTPRIGIDYAGDARDWPLRFYDAASAAVSVRK
jgi:DNA-3-methyladenine glycosylase